MQHYKPNYLKFGNCGNVVFFLHGYGGNCNSFRRSINSLYQKYECISFDLYGFGMTPHPKKKMDIYEYAIQLYLFCVEKKIRKLSIVGHSFGGRIAILLSSIFDLEIESIVLVDSAGLKPRRSINYYISIYKYKIAKKIKAKVDNKYGSDEYKKIDGYKRESYVAIVNQYLDYLLDKIKTPALIVWGKKDKDTPIYMCNKLHKKIINANRVVFKNCGHFSYIENIYKFNMVLKNYLGRVKE